MGQYYIAVNLDKKQYLQPHDFGDGAKLLEFGASGVGMMTGLAVLLADGNGRGGGDLQGEPCKKCKLIVGRPGTGYQHNDKAYKRYHAHDAKERCPGNCNFGFLPNPIVGSWAGDRIVITGDYADADKWGVQTPWGKDELDEGQRRPNLYVIAGAEGSGYENISAQVLKALRADGYLAKELPREQESMGAFISRRMSQPA